MEAGGVLNGSVEVGRASGRLTVSDVDAGQGTFVVAPAASLAGTYGTFTFNAASGAWSYTLDDSRAATQALTQGQLTSEIGRASCRERVEISVGAVSLKKKKDE